MHYWFALLFAGIFEVIWSYYMKLSDGFKNPIYTIITLTTMFISFGLLAYAMKHLPLGTAYALWTGIGVVGAFMLGIILLGESVNPLRILAAILIISGIVLMQFSTPS